MAYWMQARAPELMDFSKESRDSISTVSKRETNFASNCLLARRLAERGTRFIQLYHSGWDAHSNVEGNVWNQAKQVDQASTALVQDLKRLGMLEDTLVVWGGEFKDTDRASSPSTGAMAGTIIRRPSPCGWRRGQQTGHLFGEDRRVWIPRDRGPVHAHDLQATILKLMGIDHTRLSFRFQGLDFRLTGVEPHHPVETIA